MFGKNILKRINDFDLMFSMVLFTQKSLLAASTHWLDLDLLFQKWESIPDLFISMHTSRILKIIIVSYSPKHKKVLPPFQNKCLNFILALVWIYTKLKTLILERREYNNRQQVLQFMGKVVLVNATCGQVKPWSDLSIFILTGPSWHTYT